MVTRFFSYICTDKTNDRYDPSLFLQILAVVSVRFAWRETAQPNLFNDAGLPAYPFMLIR